ncbi:MAG: response regulator [Bilifractor sp.]|jgi:two-component system response regulator YesN
MQNWMVINALMHKVLLVDDEVIILEGFQKLFDWRAHNCVIVGQATDGLSAVAQTEDLSPDIVLMDINLPLLNGIEAFKKIHAFDDRIRCIIISGYDDFSYCREALRLSVDDYILKPVDYHKFGDVLDRSIQNLETQKLQKMLSEEEHDQETSLVLDIVRWLNSHYQENITLQTLSDEFHLNGAYISQLFKNKIGSNYSAYLSQIRMNKAKQLLRTTDLSIAEIADLTGYKDYRTFNRAYKACMGKVPSAERL